MISYPEKVTTYQLYSQKTPLGRTDVLKGFQDAGSNMNSYISLMLDAKGAEGRIHNVFESGPENKAGHPSLVAPEASIWVVSFALVILGLTKAAYSSESTIWLAITAFLRQGCHYRNGVLVLGRR